MDVSNLSVVIIFYPVFFFGHAVVFGRVLFVPRRFVGVQNTVLYLEALTFIGIFVAACGAWRFLTDRQTAYAVINFPPL